MIIGSFESDGRPFVEGLLVIPSLGLATEVSLLVDTGSDATCLMPADGMRIGIDYDNLDLPRVPSAGVGGYSNPYQLHALLAFTEDNGKQRTYVIDLLIYPRDSELDTLDSLLGRDVLNRWSMKYAPTRNNLAFTAHSADQTVSL